MMKYGPLKIFSGRSNPLLASEICTFLNVPLGNATVKQFPDGENFVKIDENIRGSDVFIVQPTCSPANDNIMELLIMIDAARRASAARITPVISFFGYARQDRKDKPRVAITAKLIANMLVAAGANRILTLDLHAQQIQGFFDIPVDHLFAAGEFYKYLAKNVNTENLTICSPDVGGVKMTAAYADMLACPFAMVAKRRIDSETVEAINLVGEVAGREVLLVDDMIESVGTLEAAAKIIKDNGAKSVRAAVTHGVLTESGYKRLQNGCIDELITTNSVPVDPRNMNIKVLSVAELLGEAINRIHNHESVTSLFKIKGY